VEVTSKNVKGSKKIMKKDKLKQHYLLNFEKQVVTPTFYVLK